jgi:hypothetical protein
MSVVASFRSRKRTSTLVQRTGRAALAELAGNATLRTLLLCVVSALASPGALRGQGWYNASWQYRKAITIDFTKVGATGAPHANFPVLISVTDANLAAHAQTDADDILFTTSDGTTKLDHEIEKYTSASGALIAWVRVPSLSAASNTVVYIYYGNASAGSQQNANAVWNSNFGAVWHYREGSGASLGDATANANTGTLNNSPAWTSSGKIGNALTFDGINDWVGIPNSTSLNISGTAITISTWVNITNNGSADYVLFGKFYNATMTTPFYQYGLEFDNIGNKTADFYFGSAGVLRGPFTVTPATGTWAYIAFTYDGTNVRGYLNGNAPILYAQTGNITARTQPLRMGADNNTAQFNWGTLDELRVSNTVRSTGWLLTEYNNESSPSTFYSLGAEQAIKTWDGGAGTNNWGDANNWNPDGVPISTDDVSLTGANTINVNVAGVVNNLTLNNASLVLTVKSGNSLTVSGNLTVTTGTLNTEAAFPAVTGTTTLTAGTVGFTASSGSQAVAVKNYADLVISGGGTKTLAGTITPSGNLSVNGGTFDLGTFTANRSSAGGTLTVANGATLKIGGTGTLPSNYSAHSIGATSTVEYAGTTTTVAALNSSQNYGNLTISGTGVTTAASFGVATALTVGGGGSLIASAGTVTMNNGSSISNSGTLTFSSLAVAASAAVTGSGNFAVGTTFTVGASGTFTPNAAEVISGAGTLTGSGTVQVTRTAATADFLSQYTITTKTLTNLTVEYAGAAAQVISALTYGGLKMNNASGVTMGGNATVDGTLTLASGIITTGANSVIISATGSASRSSGHVFGNFQKWIATGATSKTFEIGDASSYTPVDMAFASVSVAGNLTAKSTAGDYPNIGSSTIISGKSVNRYWTLTNSGITFTSYSATFTFVAGDVDGGANTANFIAGKYNAGWSYPTVGTKTGTTTQITGATSFGDVQLGESGAANMTLAEAVSPSGTQPPGTDLAYITTFTNTGTIAAQSVVITSPVPGNTDFKLGSETHNLGTTGLSVAVAYSSDGGSTWTYTPVSGAGGAPAGYDRVVTHVRWTFTGNLSQTAPNNSGTTGVTVRIR